MLSSRLLAILSVSVILLAGCNSFNNIKKYSKPKNLLFQDSENKELLNVLRDEKLCDRENIKDQSCPIDFYIDDFKSGTFFVNTHTTYYLKPQKYILKVKNCTKNCFTNEVEIDLTNQLQNRSITLTIDGNNRPFIIQK